jgi:flagellar basal-body rod protein FlgB
MPLSEPACGDPQFELIHSSLKPYLAEPNYMTDISQHFQSLSLAIEFARENHRVIGQNLANVNTPGYKTAELSFEDLLSKIEGGNQRAAIPGDADSIHFETHETADLPVRSDGNNVDMDREVARLKKNSLAYQTLTQLLGSKIGMLQRAING